MDKDEIVIRPARPFDVPDMLRLLECANMHYIPSEEMPDLDWRCYYVAYHGERLVGLSGYKVLDYKTGKTQLMVVDPAYRGRGIGMRLQEARLEAMARRGIKKVITNADRPETIRWYCKHFGYVEVGTLPKVHEFGLPHVDRWTTLEMDLERWWRARRGQG